MVTGVPPSPLKVIETVCDDVPTFVIPRNVFQTDPPCCPAGANGKNKLEGALAVETAFVNPISAPPGNFVISEALTGTLEVTRTASMLSSLFKSPRRKDADWNPASETAFVVKAEPSAAFNLI